MRVVIDQPREHKASGCIDHLRALGGADLPDSGDRLALDQYVAGELVVCRDDGPAGDEGRLAHSRLLLMCDPCLPTSAGRPCGPGPILSNPEATDRAQLPSFASAGIPLPRGRTPK